MKSAIIGLGVISELHFNAIKETGAEVCALCDIDREKAERFKKANNSNAKVYGDYRELIDVEKPDVVHICTPHNLHADMVIYALERNVNVICEKPLCISRADFDRILAAEKNSQAQLGVCFQNRYKKSNAYVLELLKEERDITAFAAVPWKRDGDYYAGGDWRGKWQTEGGGALINQAIHTLDFMLSLCGKPQDIRAVKDNLHLKGIVEVEDVAVLRVKTERGGFVMTATTASFDDLDVLVQIKTPEYKVVISGNDVFVNGKRAEILQEDGYSLKPCYGLGHFPLIKDFYDCVETGRKFAIDGAEGIRAVEAVLSAYEAAEK